MSSEMKLLIKLIFVFIGGTSTHTVSADSIKKFQEQFACSSTAQRILDISKEFNGDIRTIGEDRPMAIFVGFYNFTFYFDFIESNQLGKMTRINFGQNISERTMEILKC